MIIESSDGKSKLKLTEAGRVRTIGVSAIVEEAAANNGSAFAIHGTATLDAAASGGLFLLHFHTAGYTFHITRVYFDCLTLSKSIRIQQLKEPTRSSGGSEIGATAFVQKNFTSNDAFNGHFYVANGAGAQIVYSSEGTKYHDFVVKSEESYLRDMHGTNVMGQLDYVGWKWLTLDGTNAATTDKINITINGYLVADEHIDHIYMD